MHIYKLETFHKLAYFYWLSAM